MLRQSGHREFHDDRYSMYSYDNYFVIKAIPKELLKTEKYFYNISKKIIKNSKDVPLRQTLFGMKLPTEFWEVANQIQAQREALALKIFSKHKKAIYQNRYYSDFDMWLRDENDWKKWLKIYLFLMNVY